jgi:MFS family permease
MRQTLATIASLLLSVAILLAGNGLQSTLLAVRANFEGFSLTQIGLLMSGYNAGLIAGCYLTPHLVRRVGHVRVFAALASLASAIAIAHLLAKAPMIWIVFRVLSGLCLAGLTMVIESWINEKANNANRGKILSVYRIVDFSALTIGQLLLTMADPHGFALFCLVSILVSLSLVPVALTTSVAPQPIHSTHLRLREINTTAPLAVATCLAVGLGNGAFWAVGPAFVQQSGYGTHEIALFMALVIIGGALSQWPLGAWSDRADRRKIIIGVTLFAAAAGVTLWLLSDFSRWLMLISGFTYGCFALALYALAIAHANDNAKHGRFVEISGSLLLVYGVGAVIGPVVAGRTMELIGPQSLFAYTATIHILLVIFGIIRLSREPTYAIADQEHFVPVPRTVPTVFELDPRGGGTNEVHGHSKNG